MIKVKAANETMVKYLKHPVGNIGFRDSDFVAQWPDDQFTTRRIRDGDVVVVNDEEKATKSDRK